MYQDTVGRPLNHSESFQVWKVPAYWRKPLSKELPYDSISSLSAFLLSADPSSQSRILSLSSPPDIHTIDQALHVPQRTSGLCP
jgi:hypothetical protein